MKLVKSKAGTTRSPCAIPAVRPRRSNIDKMVKDGEAGEDEGMRAEKELDAMTRKHSDTIEEDGQAQGSGAARGLSALIMSEPSEPMGLARPRHPARPGRRHPLGAGPGAGSSALASRRQRQETGRALPEPHVPAGTCPPPSPSVSCCWAEPWWGCCGHRSCWPSW